MTHEEFAYRAEGRLLEAADRLEGEARDLGVHGDASKAQARAGELRVAALLIHRGAWKECSANFGGGRSSPGGRGIPGRSGGLLLAFVVAHLGVVA